ncbi:serine/threonine protein kinase [Triangularia setosa]|uniref:non-specific serine/threonine protein kinase n=1 Tax=Triangularia setosa TaxID=2587417 RepID=A0AAN6W7X1_9PEZI|nr:serine/threonine protein kinase [Podospora setosa]
MISEADQSRDGDIGGTPTVNPDHKNPEGSTDDRGDASTTPDDVQGQAERASDAPSGVPQGAIGDKLSDPDGVEEGKGAYFYIGEVYADKYEIMRKIGYGRYSRVWLAKDLSKAANAEDRFRALKVLSAECYGVDYPVFGREILKHLRTSNQHLPGYKCVCHLVNDFEHKGPNGTHVCLVFELMGESLATFGTYFRGYLIPTPLMRKFSVQLILALHFAHVSNVVHSDLKEGNTFIRFQDTSRIESEFLVKHPTPGQNRTEEQYTPISSRSLVAYYTAVDPRSDPTFRLFGLFNIALGDLGASSWADKHVTENIQPVVLRAPEVYRARRLFSGQVPPDGHYELRQHLAEIVDHLGPFPKELLAQGDGWIVESMLDDEGRIKGVDSSGVPPLKDEVWWSGCMMKINPADRLPVEELIQHPWISKNVNR